MKKLITILIFTAFMYGCNKSDGDGTQKCGDEPAVLSGTVWLFSEVYEAFSYSSTMVFMRDGEMMIIRIEKRNATENKSIIPATYIFEPPKVYMEINGHTQTGVIDGDTLEIIAETEGGGFVYTKQ